MVQYSPPIELCELIGGGFSQTKYNTEEEIEALSDFAKEWRNRKPYFRNINLRVLNDFDYTTLKARQLDGWNTYSHAPYQNP